MPSTTHDGMVTILRIKNVMTGGWFMNVLPTLDMIGIGDIRAMFICKFKLVDRHNSAQVHGEWSE